MRPQSGESCEERLSGQHEPRNPHADERVMRHLEWRRHRFVDRQRQYLRRRKPRRRTAGDLEDILDFSKIEAGKMSLDPITFALRDSIDDIVSTMSLRPTRRIWSSPSTWRPPFPSVDRRPRPLRRSCLNLVGNAIKFTSGGVVVRIDATPATHGANEVELHVQVSDSGIGILKENSHGRRIVRAGGHLHDASVRRHRSGADDRVAVGGDDAGRIWIESGWARQHVHFTGARLGATRDGAAVSTVTAERWKG